jgi:hypothetical protein
VVNSGAQAVSKKMPTSVVYFVLLAVMAATCDTKLKLFPSHQKESSTTFLRLTALRDDEGMWIARFGEYEVRTEMILLLNLFNDVI